MLDLLRRMTLHQRLVALAGIAILPPLAALVLVVVAFHQQSDHVVERDALRTSEIVALEMQRIVSGAEGVLASLGTAVDGLGVGAGCAAYLDTVSAALPEYGGFAITDPDGTVLCKAGGLDIADIGGEARRTALQLSDAGIGLYTPTTDGTAYLPIALALPRPDHPIVVLTALDLGWLGDRLSERTLGRGSVIVVADQAGTIVARQPQREAFVGEHLTEAMSAVLTLDRPGVRRVLSRDEIMRVVGYQPTAATGLGLFVAAGFSTHEAMAPVWESTWRAAAVVLFGAAISFIFAAAAGERLLRRPVMRIVDTVERWRAGDETARTGITGDASELSMLAAAIDQYRDELLAARAAREASEARRGVLLREMNHRIKNLFATVQAIANQSFRDRAPPDSLRTFGARLAAMARAHDLLVGENRESANLEQMIHAAIEPFRGEGEVCVHPDRRASAGAGRGRACVVDGAARALHQRGEIWRAQPAGRAGRDHVEGATRRRDGRRSGRPVLLLLDRERRSAGSFTRPDGLRDPPGRAHPDGGTERQGRPGISADRPALYPRGGCRGCA